MKKLKKLFSAAVYGSLLAPALALAQFNVGDAPEGVPDDLGAEGVSDVLFRVINFALGILAALAILVIIISGILYITSGGDEDRIERAKTYLIFAIVGLVVALLGYVIVAAVSGALGAGV